MKLQALIQNVPGVKEILGDIDTQITSLCIDSRKVEAGALFFCIPGFTTDGHKYAPQAVAKGACALVVERRLDVECAQVVVENAHKALSYMAANFYGNPAKDLILVGITGTKGKTTTSYLVKSVLEHAGKKVGLIGTVCSMIGDEAIPAELTSPDPLEVQSLFRRMADAGVEYVVMEISAHALSQDRVSGLTFEVGAFTNFSQDHLDFYKSMDEYFQAKMLFFRPEMTRKIVYNNDDERVAEAMRKLGREALKVGIRAESDMYANDIEIGERGLSFLLTRHKQFRLSVSMRLAGIFNVYNALIAAGICTSLGISTDDIRGGIEKVRSVPGRIELLDTDTRYRVILDYAHSPDSLENILRTVRQMTKGRMIALFGCGGNRDRIKRPIMGEIGGKLADYCILTSDNPRNEDPMEILRAIEEGIQPTGCEYTIIENRREAIRYALTMANDDDVIVLAGKGHETYQEIKGVKHDFDEKVVVAELLREIHG